MSTSTITYENIHQRMELIAPDIGYKKHTNPLMWVPMNCRLCTRATFHVDTKFGSNLSGWLEYKINQNYHILSIPII